MNCSDRKYCDGTKISSDQIFKLMKVFYDEVHIRGMNDKQDYYCGITNDVNTNLQRHHIENYLIAYECKNADVAAEVEGLLHNDGFDTGNTDVPGNGGTDDSVIVYMYKKSNETIE